MRESRGSWYLLTGVILGLAFGLISAWIIWPVEYVDAAPWALRDDFKAQYRLLVAMAYLDTENLPRAVARLEQLQDPNIAQTLALQAQMALAEGHPEAEARALGLLAVELGEPGAAPSVSTAPATPSPTTTPTSAISPTPLLAVESATPSLTGTPAPTSSQPAPPPTGTLLPTRTPTTTPGAPFVLQELSLVCDPDLDQPLIQVQASDAAGQPVPGLEIIVSGPQGEDRFFTGLKPELGLGYADYLMIPENVYTLRLAEGGESVPDITPAECEGQGGARYWGSWLLVFVQP